MIDISNTAPLRDILAQTDEEDNNNIQYIELRTITFLNHLQV
jgi:hypothetical protein